MRLKAPQENALAGLSRDDFARFATSQMSEWEVVLYLQDVIEHFDSDQLSQWNCDEESVQIFQTLHRHMEHYMEIGLCSDHNRPRH